MPLCQQLWVRRRDRPGRSGANSDSWPLSSAKSEGCAGLDGELIAREVIGLEFEGDLPDRPASRRTVWPGSPKIRSSDSVSMPLCRRQSHTVTAVSGTHELATRNLRTLASKDWIPRLKKRIPSSSQAARFCFGDIFGIGLQADPGLSQPRAGFSRWPDESARRSSGSQKRGRTAAEDKGCRRDPGDLVEKAEGQGDCHHRARFPPRRLLDVLMASAGIPGQHVEVAVGADRRAEGKMDVESGTPPG